MSPDDQLGRTALHLCLEILPSPLFTTHARLGWLTSKQPDTLVAQQSRTLFPSYASFSAGALDQAMFLGNPAPSRDSGIQVPSI